MRAATIVLLPRQRQREFAVADALGETFGKAGGGFLAIGGHEFGEGGEQAGLRQTVAVDAVEARLRPGLVQIAERSPLLLMVRPARPEPETPGLSCRIPLCRGPRRGPLDAGNVIMAIVTGQPDF